MMKSQINTLRQLQELVLTRDEHHQTGDGSHLDALNDSIAELQRKLQPQVAGLYDRLYKKSHIVVSAMSNNCCAVCGMQVGGLATVSAEESYGLNVAGLANLAKTAYGLQLALLFNYTTELHGAQISLINYTEACPSGFQIGLVNIIMQNRLKFLPIVNGYF